MSYPVLFFGISIGIFIGVVIFIIIPIYKFIRKVIRGFKKTTDVILNTFDRGRHGYLQVEIHFRRGGQVLRQEVFSSTSREAKKLDRFLKKNLRRGY